MTRGSVAKQLLNGENFPKATKVTLIVSFEDDKGVVNKLFPAPFNTLNLSFLEPRFVAGVLQHVTEPRVADAPPTVGKASPQV
jgi:hypothetical protein